MFESEWLDSLSRAPVWLVPAIYLPLVTLVVGWSRAVEATPWSSLAAQIGLGWVAWTLMEYGLHRTVFHWVPDTAWGERFHFYVHGVHHQWFQDRYRLVMPPAVSLTLAALVFGGLWALGALAGSVLDPSWVKGVYAGIVFGYTVYDCTHYALHHAKPLTPIGHALRAHHNKHHHNAKYAEKKFGVSTTLWDHVFRTYD